MTIEEVIERAKKELPRGYAVMLTVNPGETVIEIWDHEKLDFIGFLGCQPTLAENLSEAVRCCQV